MKIIEMKVPDYILTNLASYFFGCEFCPAVTTNKKGYQLRLINSKNNWEYYYADETGLVLESPRGRGRDFNKKIRFTNLPELVEEYKLKITNQYM